MWFPPIKQLFHPIVRVSRHALKTGMFKPVLGSILCQGKFPKAVSGDAFVQVQKNTETCLRDERMSGYRRNVITVGNSVAFFSKAGRRQEFLD
jgi:hypothetical protein